MDVFKVPKALLLKYEEISLLTDAYCEAKLDEEFKFICRMMTATLSRKRPSPLTTGRANTWAMGIAFAVAELNFGFDPALSPWVKKDELAQHFGLAQRTAAAKSNEIIKLLNTMQFDPQWTVPSRLLDNPMAWLVEVEGGMIVDARNMPREFQEAAYELGVIPFVPDDLLDD